MVEVPVNIQDLLNGSSLTPALSSVFGPLIPYIQAIGIAVIVYVIFLIIKSFISIRAALRDKKMAKDISEINEKLGLLLERFPAAKEKKVKRDK